MVSIIAGAFLIFNPSQFHSVYGFELSFDRAFFVGLSVLILGLFFRYLHVRRPTDESVDAWTIEDLKVLETRALELMDLDRRELLADPIVLTSFPDIDRIGNTFRGSLYGKDNVLRFTPRAVTVLCFTEDVAVSYEGAVDLLTGNRVYEKTIEFFYRDIATVGLQKAAIIKDLRFYTRMWNTIAPWRWSFWDRINRIVSGRSSEGAGQRSTREFFQINLADRECIKVVLRDGRLAGDRIYDEIPITTDDKIIRVVREFVAKMKNEQLRGRAPGQAGADR